MRAIAILFLSMATASATVRDCTTCDPADILNLYKQSSDGDAIHIPAGNYIWNNRLRIAGGSTGRAPTPMASPKAITIYGDGDQSGGTRITSKIGAPWFRNASTITWVIKDGTTSVQAVSRLSGIYFATGDSGAGPGSGLVAFYWDGNNNTNSRFRMDHCTFETNQQNWISNVVGVIDHCTFIHKQSSNTVGTPAKGGNLSILRPQHDRWNGGQYGNRSRSEVLDWNSDNWIYVEDCTYWTDGGNNSINASNAFTDASYSSRIIVRHCTLHGGGLLTHGPETNWQNGGVVAYGKFMNIFYSETRGGMSDMRSGVEIAYGNRVYQTTNTNSSGGFPQKNYRQYNWFMNGGVDGNPANKGGALDANVQNTDGTRRVFFAGKTANASALEKGARYNVQIVKTDGTDPGWTDNQWRPDSEGSYVIVNLAVESGSNLGNPTTRTYPFWSAVINSNSSSRSPPVRIINFMAGAFYGRAATSFAAGDAIEIRKIKWTLDQPGVHGGSVFRGAPVRASANARDRHWNEHGTPSDARQSAAPFPPGENDQQITPCYNWDNYVWNTTNNSIGARLTANNFGMNSTREGYNFINLSGSSTNQNADGHSHWTGSTPPPCTGPDTPHGCFTEYVYPHPLVSKASPTPTPVVSPSATPTATPTAAATVRPSVTPFTYSHTNG